MADGTTPVLGLVKPEVGASKDTWGQKTNDNWDKIDVAIGAANSGIAGATFPAGTRLLFQQTAAPTGWTKDVSQNDKALRVVSGAVTVGGSLAFSAAFASRGFSGNTNAVAITGSVDATVLTEAQIPAHTHFTVAAINSGSAIANNNQLARTYDGTTNLDYALKGSATGATVGLTSPTGGAQGHTHTFNGSTHSHTFSGAVDMAVQYVDVIIAVKN